MKGMHWTKQLFRAFPFLLVHSPMRAECMPEHVPFPSLPNGFTEFRMHAHSFIFFGGAFGNAAVAKQALILGK
jgi:hypothetical protein